MPAEADDLPDGGPLSLIVDYHVIPSNRTALRDELETAGGRQFQHWKDEGILQTYRLLFNRYADSNNPDAIALLTFSSYADVERWKKIEHDFPAGLTKNALALTTAIYTAPADLVRSGRNGETSNKSVFMVIPYETMISAADYLKYADGYVIPQFEGWMSEGILVHYGVYVNRYPAGRPWSTMVILEYKSDAALGLREAVVAKVRAKLKENPEWKSISDSKKNVRNEKQLVVADPIIIH